MVIIDLIKRYKWLVFVSIIHLFYLLPLVFPGIPLTHDAELHIARFAAYYKALTDFQIPPRWASDLNFNFGTPLFIFFYPLPGYLGGLLHLLFNVSFNNSYKILVAISFVLAPTFFYLWMRMKFSPQISAFSSLLYGLAPYHFLDLYVRGSISDLLGFVFIPLVFWSIDKFENNPKIHYFLIGVIAYALLIMSQNVLGLVFSLIFFGYTLVKAFNRFHLFKYLFSMLIIGLLLSAFFWLPALIEQRYTHSDLFLKDKFQSNFPTIRQLLYSPWGYGTQVSEEGGLSPQIGPLHILIVLISIISLRKLEVKKRKMAIFWSAIFLLSIFFSLSVSRFVWNYSPLLQKFEFPWRFTAISSFIVAVLAPYLLETIKSKFIIYIGIVLLLITSLPLAKVNTYTQRDDTYYLTYKATTEFGAATTIWSAAEPITFPDSPIQIISGNGNVLDLMKKSTRHTFTVQNETDTTVLDNTLYFPGWRVTVNDQKVPIEFQDANYRGLITFKLPRGIHKVSVSFHESPIRLIGNSITLITLILIVVLIFLKSKLKIIT